MGEIAPLSLMSQTEHMPPPPRSGLWGSRGRQSVRLSLDAFTHAHTHWRVQRPNRPSGAGSCCRPCPRVIDRTGFSERNRTSFISSELSCFQLSTRGAEGHEFASRLRVRLLCVVAQGLSEDAQFLRLCFLLSHTRVGPIMSVLSLPALFQVGVKRVINPPQSAIQACDNDNQRCTPRLGWDFGMPALSCLLSSFSVRVFLRRLCFLQPAPALASKTRAAVIAERRG